MTDRDLALFARVRLQEEIYALPWRSCVNRNGRLMRIHQKLRRHERLCVRARKDRHRMCLARQLIGQFVLVVTRLNAIEARDIGVCHRSGGDQKA